jgi:hypothetical protein
MATQEPAQEEYKKQWEREETKFVRPFKSADDYLTNAALRLYADDSFDEHPVIQVDSIDRERLSPSVKIYAPSEQLEELVGAPLKDLTFVTWIEDRLLKNATVLRTTNLAKIKDEVIDLGDSVLEAASWVGDTRIHVAAVLSKNRKAPVGLAYRAGNWIAKKTFSITRVRDNANFSITPKNEEFFKSRGLPAQTTYFVEMLSTDLNQPCEDMPDLVKVYMNETVHAALARDEDAPLSKALVRSIYVDVVTSILTVGFSSQEGEITSDSVLDVVSTRLTKETGIARAKLTQLAKDKTGTQLQAIIQAQADLTRVMIAASGRRMK